MTTADKATTTPAQRRPGSGRSANLAGCPVAHGRESIELSEHRRDQGPWLVRGQAVQDRAGRCPDERQGSRGCHSRVHDRPKGSRRTATVREPRSSEAPAKSRAEWAAKYVHLVAAARELKLWNADAFPGTVQTADYARAQLERVVTVRPADVEPMAQDRAKRVERLRAPGAPRLWLVVGEEALHRSIGGPETLRGQLEQVRDLAELENVSVQVMPFSAGAHASHGVSFSIVNLMEGRPGLVYVAGLTTSDYLGREHQRVYDLVFDKLRADALSPQGTIELINRRIAEL